MGALDGLRGYGWIQVGTDGFGLLGYVRCACLTGRGGGDVATGQCGGDVATGQCGGDVATVLVGGVSVGDGWEWGMEGICGLQGRCYELVNLSLSYDSNLCVNYQAKSGSTE